MAPNSTYLISNDGIMKKKLENICLKNMKGTAKCWAETFTWEERRGIDFSPCSVIQSSAIRHLHHWGPRRCTDQCRAGDQLESGWDYSCSPWEEATAADTFQKNTEETFPGILKREYVIICSIISWKQNMTWSPCIPAGIVDGWWSECQSCTSLYVFKEPAVCQSL